MPRDTANGYLDEFRKLSALHLTYLKYVGLCAHNLNACAFTRRSYFVYNKLVIAIMMVFAVTLLADICTNIDDLSIVTDDGCIFAGIAVVLYKVMLFQVHHEKVAQLVSRIIDNCCYLCEFPTGDEEQIFSKYLLICRVSFYGFSLLAFFLAIALLFLVPVEEGQLPIRACYPFDTTSSPWYQVGFFVEACTISIGLVAIIGIDSLNTNLCLLFLAHLEVLNVHFRKCGEQRSRPAPVDGNYVALAPTIRIGGGERRGCGFTTEFSKRFRRSIHSHRQLVASIDDFNEVFSGSMFVQMISSTSMICLSGFQATLVIGQISNAYKFMVYLLAAVSQLFYICWLGNEVMYQSACLARNQWLSEWSDELSAKTGRLLILSMIFSRRTLNLKAGVFYVLSMETFTTIMRGAYSFFALLSTVHTEGDQ